MDPNFKYRSILIERSEDFWALFDELIDDESKFLNNRTTILDSFKNGNLYGLILEEDDYLFNKRNQIKHFFCSSTMCSLYLFPIFCVMEKNKDEECSIIWNHSRNRRKGLGKKLVELLNIKNVWNPLQDSLPFWKSCGLLKNESN
jgi:hypothetical protein